LHGGKRLDIYVNGTAIGRPIQLKQPLAPRVYSGLISWSLHAEFTRFTVWLLPRPIPVPGSVDGNRPPDLSKLKMEINDDFSDPDTSVFRNVQNAEEGFEKFFEKGHYVIRNFRKRTPLEPTNSNSQAAGPAVEPFMDDLAYQCSRPRSDRGG